MAARRPRHRKQQEEELGDLSTGRFRCRFPEWWSEADPQDLAAAHARAQQLLNGGWGSVEWPKQTP